MIYNYTMEAPYVKVNKLKRVDAYALSSYIRQAKLDFKDSGDRDFINSIHKNVDYDEKNPYLYDYDKTRASREKNYSAKLRKLIDIANNYLKDSGKFSVYRLDLYGTWDYGQIVVMRRTKMSTYDFKKLEMDRKRMYRDEKKNIPDIMSDRIRIGIR